LDLPDSKNFHNQRPGTVLCRELQEFFEPIYDQTLANHKLQFFITWQGKIYLVNTYPIINQFDEVIGGVIFIRDNALMPKFSLTQDPSISLASLSYVSERVCPSKTQKFSSPNSNDAKIRKASKNHPDSMHHPDHLLSALGGIPPNINQ
jgi:hypothetical protein